MKYIKLFEEMNNDVAKKYPHLFNLFVNPKYIKEEHYKEVDEMLRKSDQNIKTPVYIGIVFDAEEHINFSETPLRKPIIETLPDNVILNGDVDLSEIPDASIDLLPNNLEVKGTLNLSFNDLEVIPKGLKVGGDLLLTGCPLITFIPEDLKVGGNLYLQNSSVTKLPSDLKVDGEIYPNMIIGDVMFDDVVNEVGGDESYWSRICESCVSKLPTSSWEYSLDDTGQGICGVKGCMNESEYYIDIEKDEIVKHIKNK